jgi:hypothetical protein
MLCYNGSEISGFDLRPAPFARAAKIVRRDAFAQGLARTALPNLAD